MSLNLYQILAICGILSPLIYTTMWILGGILQSNAGYSHVRDDISSLFAVDAPNKKLMQSFIITSSSLSLFLSIGLFGGIHDAGGSLVGPILLLISSILGVSVAFFFPLDAGGEFTSWRGKSHIILIVLSGILTIAGMIAMWARLRHVDGWKGFAWYSLISAICAFILVIISGKYANSSYRGITERFMVTPYEIYYFVLGLLLFLNN